MAKKAKRIKSVLAWAITDGKQLLRSTMLGGVVIYNRRRCTVYAPWKWVRVRITPVLPKRKATHVK